MFTKSKKECIMIIVNRKIVDEKESDGKPDRELPPRAVSGKR